MCPRAGIQSHRIQEYWFNKIARPVGFFRLNTLKGARVSQIHRKTRSVFTNLSDKSLRLLSMKDATIVDSR
ncbi:MAG: hypothetical protein BWY82_00827 [Verrucomicrobia bacterium ADurb.Bin474]|nr:MAG: hypothetical protein BWY82_00827 [Verrucomicrobia bacterium ADurb.Bin474]